MKFVSALSLLMASAANGAQDTAYYPGFSNPNTQDEMYYREAVNVLQDLEDGKFDSLHIEYHTCVWSEYGSGQDDREDCGDEDGGDEYWYMGRTQCFRANVAYSLYGVKAGSSGSSGCHKKQYINSFFTNGGIESFGDHTGIAYGNYGASATCTATQGGDGYTSTTLGCSSKGKFISATFKGSFCDGNNFVSNDGEITDLNTDLESMGCYQIYESSSGYTNAAALLTYSSACSHTEYPYTCPDPHGVKRTRDQKLAKYAQAHFRAVPLIMPIMSTVLLIGAAFLYCMANGLRDSAKRRALESTTGVGSNPSIYEKFSSSFNRVSTGVSARTESFVEKLAQYAEEEDDDDDSQINKAGSYAAPNTPADEPIARVPSAVPSVHSEKQASVAPSIHSVQSEVVHADDPVASQTEVANAMLAEKGITPTNVGSSGKKLKRPRMAKISRWIRGRFGRRNNA